MHSWHLMSRSSSYLSLYRVYFVNIKIKFNLELSATDASVFLSFIFVNYLYFLDLIILVFDCQYQYNSLIVTSWRLATWSTCHSSLNLLHVLPFLYITISVSYSISFSAHFTIRNLFYIFILITS